MKGSNYLDSTNKADKKGLKIAKKNDQVINKKYHDEYEYLDTEKTNENLINSENKIINSFIIILVLLAIFFLFTACSKNVEFLRSSVAVAAQGYINISTDNNKNYVIKIHVSDLVNAERLQPPKQSYVVWIETDKGNIDNIGKLSSSSNFISNKKEAILKTVTSFKPIKIFITAEDSINIRKPGNIIVLSTKEFN